MNAKDDTIAAIATPPGQGGVAVVRISGGDSITIADRIMRCGGSKPSERKAPALVHGFLVDGQEDVDEVLLLIMRAPNSYTKEDVVEIQCHGGNIVSRKILRTAVRNGARLAEPGEFTARAFLNGRIDLVQAEAVADLIGAQSERAATAALDQLKGGLSEKMTLIYETLMSLVADIEASLDFSEEDIPPIQTEKCIAQLRRAETGAEQLIATFGEGRLLRDGARVVISGAPNVGKSTLLNKLLACERAIVSHMPGTTRDSIEEHIVLDGFPVTLIDTAGLRDTDCEIEGAGIKRSVDMIGNADLHIYMVDSSIGISSNDIEHINKYDSPNFILVLNKTDLAPPSESTDFQHLSTIKTSLINDVGLVQLRSAIVEKIEADIALSTGPHSAISERHYRTLCFASAEINSGREILTAADHGCHVLAAAHIREAAESIGDLLGRRYHADLLDNIFSKFCVGK